MGHQMTVGLSKMAIFGDLGRYFFGNIRDTYIHTYIHDSCLEWPNVCKNC